MADQVCTAKHLHHIAIAVPNIEESLKFYQDVFGIGPAQVQELPDQKVKAALIQIGGTELELIQPTDPTTGVGRFVEQRGEAMHHICFQVDDIKGKLDMLKQKGMQLIDQQPRRGLAGTIAFIHPRSTRGVLIELVER